MKKQLLLLLLLAMFFASCSKDSDSAPIETQQSLIKGTWKETSSKYEYFDSKGVKIYEEPVVLGTITFDGKATVTAVYDGQTDTGSYSLTKEGSLDFLIFSDGTETRKYNIVSLTNTNLFLTLETLNDFYYVGSVKKTSAKSILSSSLVKN